jgi:hypothetical protein
MANRINVTRIQGGRRPVYSVYIESDGVGEEVENYELVLPENEAMGDKKQFAISRVAWSLDGFSVKLHFEELVDDSFVWVLAENAGGELDFGPYGDLKDPSNPLDGTGKLLMSTVGLAGLDSGSFLIALRI